MTGRFYLFVKETAFGIFRRKKRKQRNNSVPIITSKGVTGRHQKKLLISAHRETSFSTLVDELKKRGG